MILDLIFVVLGAILSIITTLLVEYFRVPKFSLKIEKDAQLNKYGEEKPARVAKFLRVQLWNKSKNWFESLVNKLIPLSQAANCHGAIQFFHYEDGSPLLEKPMKLRWAGTEPALRLQVRNDQIKQVIDIEEPSESYWRVCYPNRVETIDVVARVDQDEDAYGWTTDSMQGEVAWRKPKYLLPRGRYFIRVQIFSDNRSIQKYFKLENTSGIENFRLLDVNSMDNTTLKLINSKISDF